VAEMVIEKIKNQKSPGIYQIPAQFIKARIEQFALRSRNLAESG
jgi:hypothetical protein